MRRSGAVVVLSLTWWCISSAEEPIATQSLCACQREDGFLKNHTCLDEVVAECEAAGQWAVDLAYCQVDTSMGDSAFTWTTNPIAFSALIRAAAVKCKHPFTFDVAETASFVGSLGYG
jgi:hypothetical protein